MTPSHDEILAGHLSIPYPQALSSSHSTSKDEDSEETEVPLSEWQKACAPTAQTTKYSYEFFNIVARRYEIRY